MARIDRDNRRLELKIVFCGPARSGKTTALRSLHGACDARRRGEFASVESDAEANDAPCRFDFAPLDLPRFRSFALRAECYAVPGNAAFESTRRRLLRGADGVVFVGDLSPAGIDGNLAAWRALDAHLAAEERDRDPVPVVVMANKRDVAGPNGAALLIAQLMESGTERPILAGVDCVATAGTGVLKAFRKISVAAAERGFNTVEPLTGTTSGYVLAGEVSPPEGLARTHRRLFATEMENQFGGTSDGVPLERVAPRRTVAAGGDPAKAEARLEPDTGEINTAVEASRWLELRDGDVRELRRERAVGRLLADVGQICATASDVEGLVRGILTQLIMNLDAVTGWVGIPNPPEDKDVFDSMGKAGDAAVVCEAARTLALGLHGASGTVRVGAAATSGFPGGAAGGEGIFFSFPIVGGDPGWLLLVGAPGRGLPEHAESILHTATTLLGLAAARLRGLAHLHALHRALEERVEKRTLELQRDKETLEERVRERTRELEQAKRMALETEQCLFDRERQEGVQQLAAGVAHELNNPISAIKANLEYVIESMLDPECEEGAIDWEDVRSAVTDALEAANSVASRVSSLSGARVVSARRAAVRTNLTDAVMAGVTHFCEVHPDTPAPVVEGSSGVTVGIQNGELTRWIFRLLNAVVIGAAPEVQIAVFGGDEGPGIRLDVNNGITTGAHTMLRGLRESLQAAGGSLRARVGIGCSRIDVDLPPGVGSGAAKKLWEKSA